MSHGSMMPNGRSPLLRMVPGGKYGGAGGRKPATKQTMPTWGDGRIVYRVSEVAERTGFSREKVYQWIRSGNLKAYVVPKETTIVLHDDLMDFLRGRAA